MREACESLAESRTPYGMATMTMEMAGYYSMLTRGMRWFSGLIDHDVDRLAADGKIGTSAERDE